MNPPQMNARHSLALSLDIHSLIVNKHSKLPSGGRIHGEPVRLLANMRADNYSQALGHKQEFCHRRSVFFQQHRCTIGLACAEAVALHGAPTTARRCASQSATPQNGLRRVRQQRAPR